MLAGDPLYHGPWWAPLPTVYSCADDRGTTPPPGRLPGRSRRDARSCWPRRRWKPIPRQPTRDRSDAADPRRRDRSPCRPEARPLTSTENDTPTPDLPAVELEHAESGAPDPEQLEQTVESLG